MLEKDEDLAEISRKIARIRKYLNLNYEEFGQMIGTSGLTVWNLERGYLPLNPYKEKINEIYDNLMHLLKFFVPKKLASAIRRPAPIFNGERALDWILRGEFSEVVKKYEELFWQLKL